MPRRCARSFCGASPRRAPRSRGDSRRAASATSSTCSTRRSTCRCYGSSDPSSRAARGMIGLAAPIGLAALLALALPILVHLIRRAEEREVQFAALRWISERAGPRRAGACTSRCCSRCGCSCSRRSHCCSRCRSAASARSPAFRGSRSRPASTRRPRARRSTRRRPSGAGSRPGFQPSMTSRRSPRARRRIARATRGAREPGAAARRGASRHDGADGRRPARAGRARRRAAATRASGRLARRQRQLSAERGPAADSTLRIAVRAGADGADETAVVDALGTAWRTAGLTVSVDAAPADAPIPSGIDWLFALGGAPAAPVTRG